MKERTLKLHHSPFSTNSRKPRLVASMLDIPLELINVDLFKGEQRGPQFLALNPLGRVPVLEDGDFVLAESGAIMIYLADTTRPGNTLYPGGARERADVNRWLFWATAHVGPALGALTFENVLKKMLGRGEPDPVQIERQLEALRGLVSTLDRHLGSREWVSGKALTLADLSLAATLSIADRAKLPMESFVHVGAWLKRVQALEAWKATEPATLL